MNSDAGCLKRGNEGCRQRGCFGKEQDRDVVGADFYGGVTGNEELWNTFKCQWSLTLF